MEVKLKAFSLAETLITIGIVGILAAILIPNLVYYHQKTVLKNRFKKSYATAKAALLRAVDEFGAVPKCYYSYKFQSVTDECKNFYKYYFFPQLSTIQYCEKNGYENGCLPNYTMEDFPNSSGCGGFNANRIKTQSQSAILKDGTIIFTYTQNGAILGFDINGLDGPNKRGQDVYALVLGYEGDELELGRNSSKTQHKNRISVKECMTQSNLPWTFEFLDEVLN